MLKIFREFFNKPAVLRFSALAASSYVLLGARFAGVFILRFVLDPVAVGIVNSAQIFAQIFASLTGGTFYIAARKLPITTVGERGTLAWSHIAVNMIEGLILIIPATLLLFFFGLGTLSLSAVVAVSIAFFALGLRLAGLVESLLMATGSSYLASLIRVAHVFELCFALVVAEISGVAAYLMVFAFFSFIIALISLRALPCKNLSRISVIQALKFSQYGLEISIEKLIGTFSNAMDSIMVTAFGGPMALAGYYIGVSTRGAITNLVSTLYWAVWPDAVQQYDSGKINIFEQWRAGVIFVISFLIFTIMARLLLEIGIRFYLPAYAHFLPSIGIVLASTVPFALVDWDRARLVINRRTAILPFTSSAAIASFLILFFLFNKNGLEAVAICELVAKCTFLAKTTQVVISRVYIGCYCYSGEFPIITAASFASILLAFWLQIIFTIYLI